MLPGFKPIEPKINLLGFKIYVGPGLLVPRKTTTNLLAPKPKDTTNPESSKDEKKKGVVNKVPEPRTQTKPKAKGKTNVKPMRDEEGDEEEGGRRYPDGSSSEDDDDDDSDDVPISSMRKKGKGKGSGKGKGKDKPERENMGDVEKDGSEGDDSEEGEEERKAVIKGRPRRNRPKVRYTEQGDGSESDSSDVYNEGEGGDDDEEDDEEDGYEPEDDDVSGGGSNGRSGNSRGGGAKSGNGTQSANRGGVRRGRGNGVVKQLSEYAESTQKQIKSRFGGDVEKYLGWRAERHREWRQKNRDKHLALVKAWKQKNRDKYLAQKKAYYLENKDKELARKKASYQRKKQEKNGIMSNNSSQMNDE